MPIIYHLLLFFSNILLKKSCKESILTQKTVSEIREKSDFAVKHLENDLLFSVLHAILEKQLVKQTQYLKGVIMGQQINKVQKRRRRKAYLERCRERVKALIGKKK
jgi:hypothetical protein